MVSIITPVYKSEKFISNAIESVLLQTYNHWEMIIVDDCSPDNSNAIIKKFCDKDQRIKLIKLRKNSGPAIARNVGIKHASGRYIAFLDADDLWKPQKLEKQISFMMEKKCAFCCSAYDIIDTRSGCVVKVKHPPLKISYENLLKTNYIGCLTAIYDTRRLGKVYMPIIKKRQDYGLWLNIAKKIDFVYSIDEVLASYRIFQNSISSNKIDLIKYNYKIFREHENFSMMKSLYYLFWNILNKILRT